MEAWARSSAGTTRGWLRTSMVTPPAMSAPPTLNSETAKTFSSRPVLCAAEACCGIALGGQPDEQALVIIAS